MTLSEPLAEETGSDPGPPLIELRGLTVRFRTEHGVVQALGGVDLTIRSGEVVVLAGESGSGKTVLAHAILRLLPRNAQISGQVLLEGTGLLALPERRLQAVRGRRIALVPQSAGTALDPVKRLGGQLLEWAGRRELTAGESRPRLDAQLRSTGLSFAAVARRYAHQLSGGMQQRVVNAGCLVSNPDLVIADEPTHGLDADLVDATAEQLLDVVAAGSALLVITHDLRLAQRLGGRLALLYASHLVELRPTAAFFTQPAHPYGRGLLGALIERGGVPIPGLTPELTALPPGCPFAPRCAVVFDVCHEALPPLHRIEDGKVRCVHYAER
jgi:peptide/nickel transport system ATP-binding protein